MYGNFSMTITYTNSYRNINIAKQLGFQCKNFEIKIKFGGLEDQSQLRSIIYGTYVLELVCCKKQQKKCSWPVTGLQNRRPLKDLNDSKMVAYESKRFPWPSRINFMPFRIFRGPLFYKQVTGSGTFFAVSYSKLALAKILKKKKNLLHDHLAGQSSP